MPSNYRIAMEAMNAEELLMDRLARAYRERDEARAALSARRRKMKTDLFVGLFASAIFGFLMGMLYGQIDTIGLCFRQVELAKQEAISECRKLVEP